MYVARERADTFASGKQINLLFSRLARIFVNCEYKYGMKSLVKVSLSICAGVIAFFVALPWIAYFIVMLATTSYSVEWLGRGHSDSWSLHTVLIDGAELRIRF